MSKYLERESNTITISTFWENYLLKKYDFNPPYQRKSIWSDEKKSFFIDSILKNFPIPPVFLHQIIDEDSGSTKYDVIDGKQRLSSIIDFIENKIPVSDENDHSPFYDESIDGVFFEDLETEELRQYKKKFWKYPIPIEYVDSTEKPIIDNIFDRLNRNGEPLNGQELRKSQYYNSPFLKKVEEFCNIEFWKTRLENVDLLRMEDTEFISEAVFVILEGEPQHANQQTLDQMYEKYGGDQQSFESLHNQFLETSKFMEELELEYSNFKITGVSHLYGIWCFCHYCVQQDLSSIEVAPVIKSFFTQLRENAEMNEHTKLYKESMTSRTKDKTQRSRRLRSMIDFMNSNLTS